MTEEFAKGRDDALAELEKTIRFRLKFLETTIEDKTLAVPKEIRQETIRTYYELLIEISINKNREQSSNRVGTI